VSEETKTASGASSAKDRVPDGFDQAGYWVSADQNAFDLSKFRTQLPRDSRDLDEAIAIITPLNPKRHRYHVLFAWSIAEDEFQFTVAYRRGRLEQDDYTGVYVENGPNAEDFMQWFGQFFSVGSVKFHIHARFKYPLRKRVSKFPLTLSTKRLPAGAELSGVALRLTAAPNGVSSVRITKGQKHWYADVVSDRRITFKNFSPYVDAEASLTVLGMFIAERPS
jgi:hypothetical protein